MAPPRFRFEGYESATGRPHVMVDGAAREGAVLTLSHWPGTTTPIELARDLSAEIALSFSELASRGGVPGVPGLDSLPEAVTNDHFDEDGLMSLFVMVEPEAASRLAPLVVGAASCGDFGVMLDERSASVAFAVGPLSDSEAGTGSSASERYAAMLPRVGELLENPERYRHWWKDEAAAVAAGEAAIREGTISLREVPSLDLCVVERVTGEGPPLPGADGGAPAHRTVLNTATPASRVLAFDGDRCELYLRYESWVRYVSREVALRPDLEPLAGLLSAMEPSGGSWVADGVGAIVCRVAPEARLTEIDPARVESTVSAYLASAPPAWDPWRPGGGYVPVQEREGYESYRTRRPGTRLRRWGSRRRQGYSNG